MTPTTELKLKNAFTALYSATMFALGIFSIIHIGNATDQSSTFIIAAFFLSLSGLTSYSIKNSSLKEITTLWLQLLITLTFITYSNTGIANQIAVIGLYPLLIQLFSLIIFIIGISFFIIKDKALATKQKTTYLIPYAIFIVGLLYISTFTSISAYPLATINFYLETTGSTKISIKEILVFIFIIYASYTNIKSLMKIKADPPAITP